MIQLRFERGSFPKKYRVYVFENGKLIKTTQFGDQRYGQYRDKTPLKLYSSKDNLNDKRRVACRIIQTLQRSQENATQPLQRDMGWRVRTRGHDTRRASYATQERRQEWSMELQASVLTLTRTQNPVQTNANKTGPLRGGSRGRLASRLQKWEGMSRRHYDYWNSDKQRDKRR